MSRKSKLYTAVYVCYDCDQMWSAKTNDPEYDNSRKCNVCDQRWAGSKKTTKIVNMSYMRSGSKVAQVPNTVCADYVEPICVIYTKGFTPVFQRRYFGKFECDDCCWGWSSGHSWLGYRQMCKSCDKWVYPHILRQLEESNNKNRKEPHEQELCEKCQKLGYNCNF